MTKTFALGRAIFAAALGSLGVQCLLRGNAIPTLEPVTSAAALPLIGWITGIVLIAAAIASLLPPSASYGAAVIAAVMLLWVALLHLPALIVAPKNGGEWTSASESLAIAGAALVLFGLTRISDAHAARCILAGRIFFGVCMLGFGALHFIYIAYVAFVIPGWIPAHVFFGYATGVAHVAAGLGILTGVLGRIAALCTALMFGSWVLIVHGPRVIAKSQDPNEWTSMLIALAICGGALLIAEVFARHTKRVEGAID
ncbi:MAG: hypothetical protein ABI884_10640 [Gemmatimonadota bacterium]